MKEFSKISVDFSFRQIINRFLRKGKTAYNTYLTSIKGEKDCNTLQVITYLLGLEYELCKEKIALKQELDGNINLLKKSMTDPSFQSLFGIGKCDTDLELSNIRFEIERIENEMANKKYAENYADIQEKTNEISDKIDDLNNKKFILESRWNAITEALTATINVNLQDVREIYQKIGIEFNNNLIHSLEEVENFHLTLIQKRNETLNKDLLKIKTDLKTIDCKITELNEQLNENLEFLRMHSAIDKYVAAIRQIDSLRVKEKELEKVENIEKDLKNRIEQIKKNIASSNIQAQDYLDSIAIKTETINKTFISFAKTFYANKKSALLIKNNDGDNQVRFNVDARITSDGSDGIQEIITYCFDWVLILQKVTNIGFMFHDSLLIANVENRQKEILFELTNSLCKNEIQYIININQDQINGFNSNTKNLIEENTILTLTDENVSSKLLGIEVDLGRDVE
ncbi:MAG: DUF2326 domain-containing protein [Clostridia bacterium]|nr:DUF2326 domain-containing protein [Clostridia bacterium]